MIFCAKGNPVQNTSIAESSLSEHAVGAKEGLAKFVTLYQACSCASPYMRQPIGIVMDAQNIAKPILHNAAILKLI